MSEMIGRVAKALQIDALANMIDNLTDADAETLARAAILAMREPPDDIAEVMNRLASNGAVNWRDYHAAMIDAALEK